MSTSRCSQPATASGSGTSGETPARLLRAQSVIRQRPRARRASPGIQADGARVSSSGARSDPGRRVQSYRRSERGRTDGFVSRHRQRDLLLARRRQALLPQLHGHGADCQRQPPRGPRSHSRRVALLGHGDPSTASASTSPRCRPRRSGAGAGRCAAARADRRGPDPAGRQADCQAWDVAALIRSVRSPTGAGPMERIFPRRRAALLAWRSRHDRPIRESHCRQFRLYAGRAKARSAASTSSPATTASP